jgi:hypothetical protein
MKLTIANAQLNVGDSQGFLTLIRSLETENGGFARQQALEILQENAGKRFDYDPAKSVAENAAALQKIREWWQTTGTKLKYDQQAGRFQ